MWKSIALSDLSIFVYEKTQKDHTTTINLKYQLVLGTINLNYQMDHILYQIFQDYFEYREKILIKNQ